MTATTTEIFRFDLATGDRYVGEVVKIESWAVTLRRYSAWYAGADGPYFSSYSDDEVSFRADVETRATRVLDVCCAWTD